MSSKDNGEDRVMHSKSDNIEIMINDKTHPVIEELCQSLFSRYQTRLEASMKGDFIFDWVFLLYYKCHKTYFKSGGSDIDSLDWKKNKRATINLIDKNDNKAFNTLLHIENKQLQ